MNKAKKIRNTTNVLRTQSGESATQRKSCPSRLWSMSVGRPGNGRQPLDEPYTVQWMRWPISCGDQPPTGEPDAGEPPVRFGGRGDSNQSSLPLSPERTTGPRIYRGAVPTPSPAPSLTVGRDALGLASLYARVTGRPR